MAPQRAAKQQRRAAAQAAASGNGGPAASTRAAARRQQQQQQEQQLATADMPWPLLLQHDSIRTQEQLVCTLLCCSKSMAASVAEHCAGQLDMRQELSRAESTEARQQWLCKHARLLQALDLRNTWATALIAAGPQTLLLQSLTTYTSPDTLPLLEQLPASHLTHLELGVRVQPDMPAWVARVSAALGRLTALRSLVLNSEAAAALPLPGLSALAQLTTLEYRGALSDLQHVRPQLLELQLTSCVGPQQQQLDLHHLAAATTLRILCVPVMEGDVLPPGLVRLQLNNCRSVQPLLALTALQQLEFRSGDGRPDITADQLRQLSRITALSLGWNGYPAMELASAAAWPLLPLQRLELEGGSLSAAVCQHLAKLHGLSRLRLSRCQLPHAGSAQQLAAALGQLSGLQQLVLSGTRLWCVNSHQERAQQSAGMRQLVQATCTLQQLRELDVASFASFALFAAEPGTNSSLAAMTALTSLSLEQCDLSDADVAAVVSQLPPGLRRLDCSFNITLTDSAVFAMRQLQQLEWLSLSDTQMIDAGLQSLSHLTRLQHLDVRCCTHVTDPGLRQLSRLTRLRELFVPRCLTYNRRNWLQWRLPQVTRLQSLYVNTSATCFEHLSTC